MKSKFSVNQENQLLVIPPNSKNSLKPKGEFRVNKNNQLEYWLNEPASWRKLYNLPGKLVFTGRWGLNTNHDLELRLSKSRNQPEDRRLVLNGRIISVEDNILAFEMISRQGSCRAGEYSFRILKLSGTWQADKYNRLTFLIEKKRFPDELVFSSSWQLNESQQVEYAYTKTNLAKKTKTTQKLAFDGYWKIDSGHRLLYILSHNLNSGFNFKVQLENPNIYPQAKSIKYRVGLGISRPENLNYSLLSLYGEWKFNRSLGLVFRMEYGKNSVQEIEFGADVTLARNKFLFRLQNERGEPLGMTLAYSFNLLKDLQPQAFIRLKNRQRELGIEAGFTLPF